MIDFDRELAVIQEQRERQAERREIRQIERRESGAEYLAFMGELDGGFNQFTLGTDGNTLFALRGQPVETAVSPASSHSGLSDAYVQSPTLLAAAYIRASEVARAKMVVVNMDGEPVESHAVATFLSGVDTNLLIESTAHDFYIWGRAYWRVDYGGYDLSAGGARRIESITRLEPRQISRVYSGFGEPPVYMYRGAPIPDDEIVPFERYDGTGAIYRLGRYLEIERNTLTNRAVDSRYKKPKFAYTSGTYGSGSATDMAKDVKALTTLLGNTDDRPIVLPIRPNSELAYVGIPLDEEFRQVREVVIQAVSADSGVPAQFLSSEQAFTRWNVVRDARRTLWESHLARELDRMAAILTNKLVAGEPDLRIDFDTTGIEVLGDSREVDSKNATVYVGAAKGLRELGVDDGVIAEWLSDKIGIPIDSLEPKPAPRPPSGDEADGESEDDDD